MKRFKTKYLGHANIISIIVICLTITVIGTSYSVFFDINANENEQVIQTGDLIVKFDNTSSTLTDAYVYPMSDIDGISSGAQSIYYIQNNGTIDASFLFTLTKNESHVLSEKYIKIAIFEYDATTRKSSLISDIIPLSDVLVTEDGDYILYNSTIGASSSGENAKTFSIKMWLDEDVPETIIGEDIDLTINVLSEVQEAVMNYNINGYLLDSDSDFISNATISLNNGSYKTTTNESGYYVLYDVRPGTYQLKIVNGNTMYLKTLVVEESDKVTIDYKNNEYTLKGSYDKNINLLNIKVNKNEITSMEVYGNE
ncbi:MAG: carboxypeptidase-like regulatory domain-containing protein [bacterium]